MPPTAFDRALQMIGAAAFAIVSLGQPELVGFPAWLRFACIALAAACGAGSQRVLRLPGAPIGPAPASNVTPPEAR